MIPAIDGGRREDGERAYDLFSASALAAIAVTVKTSAGAPGLIRFSVLGKAVSYALTAADLPLTATFSLDPPHAATNQCGETAFSACVYLAASGAVKCQ